MVSTSLTLGHEAGPDDIAATGSVGAGDAGAGDASGLGIDMTTVGPEEFGLAASTTPGFTVDYAIGSRTLGHTPTATPDLAFPYRLREIDLGATATATPALDMQLMWAVTFGQATAAQLGLSTATTTQRIVHRVELAGVFGVDDAALDGEFAMHDEIDALVEREDL